MKPLPPAWAFGCGRTWRRFCWPPKRSVNSRMNSSICDWRDRSAARSSPPASAFIVTETLTTAGVILAASSEKS